MAETFEEGARPNVPRVRSVDADLTAEQLAEVARRGEIDFQIILTLPAGQYRQALRDHLAELEDFMEECREANRRG